MNIQKLKDKIITTIPLHKLFINGNAQHVHIIAIGDIFLGLSNIKQQQIIYKPLTQYIIKKKIHSITINTFTCKEWNKKVKNKK